MRYKNLIWCLLLPLLTQCASRPPYQPGKLFGANRKLKVFNVESSDGFFEASILAATNPMVTKNDNGFYYIGIPLSPEKLMECYLYPKRMDAGQGILSLHQQLRKSSEERGYYAPLVYNFETLFTDGTGHFLTDQIIFKRKNQNDFTNLKSTSISKDGETLMCVINFARSKRSYAQLIDTIVKSLKINKRQMKIQKPRYEQIFALKSGKKAFGWTQTLHFPMDGDLNKVVSLTSSLGPGNPVSFVGHDWITSEIYDGQHQVVEGHYIQVRNFATIFNLKIKRLNQEEYLVQGMHYEKPVNTVMSVHQGLYHHYYAQNLVKTWQEPTESAEKNTPNLEEGRQFQQYLPYLSPVSPFMANMNYTGKVDSKGHRFSVNVENLNIQLFKNLNGDEHLIESMLNGSLLTQELVHQRGQY